MKKVCFECKRPMTEAECGAEDPSERICEECAMGVCVECVEKPAVAAHPQIEGEMVCADCFEELGGEEAATTTAYRGEA